MLRTPFAVRSGSGILSGLISLHVVQLYSAPWPKFIRKASKEYKEIIKYWRPCERIFSLKSFRSASIRNLLFGRAGWAHPNILLAANSFQV